MRKPLAILLSLMLALGVLVPSALAQDGDAEAENTENQAYIRYANFRADGVAPTSTLTASWARSRT